ncbi:MAG: choice-of-anchor B family protein [Phycisphaeraceae bacterium]|nr:choice-of-anchor B family protein [Phycisphaeraceae bacterium]
MHRTQRLVGLLLIACVAHSLVGSAHAHPDDPKVRDRRPGYQGAGWRASTAAPGERAQAGGMAFPSQNLALKSWIPLSQLGGAANGNDCWGWTSPSGREYAIMCTSSGTGFVEVTDPADAQVITFIPGPVSLWRDAKVFQHYAYIVTEGTDAGIQVVDMSNADNGVFTLVNTVNTGGSTRTHNVAIDETSGFLYRCGGPSLGLRIYNLGLNPVNPPLVGEWHFRYVHDAQVVTYTSGPLAGRQIAFCCAGFNGGSVETGLTILDVTNKANIVEIGHWFYANTNYSHQVWLSEDRTFAYLNDELDSSEVIYSRTHVFRVDDLNSVQYRGWYANQSTAVTHNLYTLGDYIFAANYRSGLRVFDRSGDPEHPVEVAYFDTWPADDNPNFNGLWSVYPYFPSGTVIGSDLEKGLFVWRLELPQIAFELPDPLPGMISPAGGSLTVDILEDFAGALVAGSPRVHWRIDDDAFDAPMSPVGGEPGRFTGVIPPLPCGALVDLWFSAQQSDGLTITYPAGAPQNTFDAVIAWDLAIDLRYTMESGFDWSVQNVQLTDGAWERGVPAGDGTRGDPTTDFDGSGACWLTANRPGNSDVDGGPTHLLSPVLNLAGLADPTMSVATWFYNDDQDQDRLTIAVSVDAGPWITIEAIPHQGNLWVERTYRLRDYVVPTAATRFRFSAVDNPNDSVTEAAIDALRIVDLDCTAPPATGDLNGDGTVGFDDLLILLAAWGPCTPPCDADLSGDGTVGFDDLLLLLSNWG